MAITVEYIKEPEVGSIWKHVNSGGTYKVIDYGFIEATVEPAILYMSVDDGRKWIRPVEEFLDGRFVEVSQ